MTVYTCHVLRAVYMAVDGPCRRPVYMSAYMALTFTRPVRGRTTAVYTAVDGPYTDV